MEASPALAARIILESNKNQSEIADAMNCSQSQISRIAAGNVRRTTHLVRKICMSMHKLATPTGLAATVAANHETRLSEALSELWWERSNSQAEALVSLLGALQNYVRVSNR